MTLLVPADIAVLVYDLIHEQLILKAIQASAPVKIDGNSSSVCNSIKLRILRSPLYLAVLVKNFFLVTAASSVAKTIESQLSFWLIMDGGDE